MPTPKHRTGADLRGAARLAVDATAGLTDLVEAMHQRIGSPPGATAADGRTSGITGLVYRSVRGVTKLVGGSVDTLLGLVEKALPVPAVNATDPAPKAAREALVAVLNGVLGDHLAATQNPLAISMHWRMNGQPLPMDAAALQARCPDARGTLVLALHGLCMNDLQWQRNGQNHADALAAALGGSAVYLHYNSGLAIADNGRLLATHMAQLLAAWPVPVQRVLLLTHSMGGLVARSALHQAAEAGQAWTARVDDLVCLGTPHLGAPLERAGRWVDVLLDAAPYAAPLARLGRVRSAGINDLRHGRVRPLPAGADDQAQSTRETPLPLPIGLRCWAVAGCLGASADSLKTRLAGDGLVPLDSALGQHPDSSHALAFPPERQCVALGVGHMALLSDPGVQAQLLNWFPPAKTPPAP